METQETTLTQTKFRKSFLIGDVACWYMIRTTPFFKTLLIDPGKALWNAFTFYNKLNLALMAFFSTTFFRDNKGRLQGGLIPLTLTAFTLINCNYTGTHYLLSGLGIFITPYLLFTSDFEEIKDIVFFQTHSKPLSVLTGLFLVIGFYQSIRLYVTGGNQKSFTSRGTSWFWRLLIHWTKPKRGQSRRFHPSEFWCEFLFETLIMVALGFLFLKIFDDLICATVCFSAGIFEAIQTLDDNSEQQKQRNVLNI